MRFDETNTMISISVIYILNARSYKQRRVFFVKKVTFYLMTPVTSAIDLMSNLVVSATGPRQLLLFRICSSSNKFSKYRYFFRKKLVYGKHDLFDLF